MTAEWLAKFKRLRTQYGGDCAAAGRFPLSQEFREKRAASIIRLVANEAYDASEQYRATHAARQWLVLYPSSAGASQPERVQQESEQ